MISPRVPVHRAQLWLAVHAVGLLVGGAMWVWGGSACAAEVGRQPIPGIRYQAAFSSFYDGQFDDALKTYEDQWRGAIRTVQSRWIDSICYHTMMGECYYHLGQTGFAYEQYTLALRLYLMFPDWMLRVQFPATIRPDTSSNFRQIPWGASSRRAQVGSFPNSMLIGQGQVDNNRPYYEGGVVQSPVLVGINVQEIVRCTALAIRRRAELLGPIAPHDPMTGELIAALSRRPAPPNHWSQAWVDVELALALIAGGKTAEALPLLNRSVVAAGQYDHPLTSVALFELGHLAMLQGNYAEAIKQFEEASYSAVQFQDYGMVEESLRWAALAHLLSNRREFYGPLVPASQWARIKGWRYLQASLLLSGAENYLALRQGRQAADTLGEAQAVMGRRAMGAGDLGGRLNYLRALAFFQEHKVPPGSEALAAALNYMQRASRWLFQIRLIEKQYSEGQLSARGSITPRTAVELYGVLLRDPQAIDWLGDPMEALAVLHTPHPEAFEHWFLIALERKEYEKAIEIADRARRHRFFCSLALGGRLQSLQWILEAPEAALSGVALEQRQALLAGNPEYGRLSQQAKQLRKALESLPLVAPDGDALRKQSDLLAQLGQVSVQQEAILHEIAVCREPAEMAFPPLRTTKEIQAGLPHGTALLVFFTAADDLYGFLLNNEKYGYWRVKGGNLLTKRVTSLLHGIGQYEANRELTVKELNDGSWKEAANHLLDGLLEGSQADFSQSFPELVIVPDGVLWYLPFEMLEVKVGDRLLPLISRIRMRYAPTASLAIADSRGTNPAGRTAVVLGRLYPRQDASVAEKAFEQFARTVPGSVAVSGPMLPAPSGLYASEMERLVVLDDITMTENGPYGWSPIPIDRGKPGSALADWFPLPWEGPSLVVLPGFHTASENALKRFDRGAPGSEVFLSICGLMASGARTILLSRWRTGGQSSFDLVREFTQELPDTEASDAWQRAVLLLASSRVNLEAEPRVKSSPSDDPPKGTHPFFWAGYLLVDSGAPVARAAEPAGAGGLQLMEPGQQPDAGQAGENGDAKEMPPEPEAEEPGVAGKRGSRLPTRVKPKPVKGEKAAKPVKPKAGSAKARAAAGGVEEP